MNTPIEPERYEFSEKPRYRFAVSRRGFLQTAGVGLLLTSTLRLGFAQGRQAAPVNKRLHFDPNGTVTVFCGKVEVGQGARTQVAQAVAEELRVPLAQVVVVLADTDLVPNDGGTYGSQTTPRTIPAVREAAAVARELLLGMAAAQWQVEPGKVSLKDGVFRCGDKELTLAALVASVADVKAALAEAPADAAVTEAAQWTVLGQPAVSQGGEGVVTGKHRYVSDIKRKGMLYGAILRAPAYNARLVSLDEGNTGGTPALPSGAQVVRDGEFIGCVAPTRYETWVAVDALAKTAQWDLGPHPSSDTLYQYLREHALEGSGRQRSSEDVEGNFEDAAAKAAKVIRAAYHVPYIQHAPMETRSAVAEWQDGRLTVWTGTQRPFDVRDDLAEAFGLAPEQVRLIVPDTGGGFGGKHQPDAAVEAARLSKAAGRPVSVQWTRAEEFMWAYFRPAGLIEVEAALDAEGGLRAWSFVNYNSGGSGIETPYAVAAKRIRFQACDAPLRPGSYRGLAAAANHFAREAFMDRLAAEAGRDPVEYRLAHLGEARLKDVLNAAAEQMGWTQARMNQTEGSGYGIACGTEKGSYVATGAEVFVDTAAKSFKVRRLWIAYECGAVHNPANLRAQIVGGVVMGLGAALREAIEFQDGKLRNGSFKDYKVPRFEDMPEIDVVVLDRKDLPSVGAGETPIVAVAPAIANALFHATKQTPEALPLRLA